MARTKGRTFGTMSESEESTTISPPTASTCAVWESANKSSPRGNDNDTGNKLRKIPPDLTQRASRSSHKGTRRQLRDMFSDITQGHGAPPIPPGSPKKTTRSTSSGSGTSVSLKTCPSGKVSSRPTVTKSTGFGRKSRNRVVLQEDISPAASPNSLVANRENEIIDLLAPFQQDKENEDEYEEVSKAKNKDDDGTVAEKEWCPFRMPVPDHITVVDEYPPMFQCTVCKEKFKTKVDVKYHVLCPKTDKPNECQEGGEGAGFITKADFEYLTGERPYLSGTCDKGIKTRNLVKRRIMGSHTDTDDADAGKSLFVCAWLGCNQKFSSEVSLKDHYGSNHTDDRPFSCDHCTRRFARKAALDNHLKIHSSQRTYPCDYDQCTIAFNDRKNLRQHLLSHKGKRQLHRGECGKSFPPMERLRRRIKMAHNHKQTKEVAKKLAKKAAAKVIQMKRSNQKKQYKCKNSYKNNDKEDDGPVAKKKGQWRLTVKKKQKKMITTPARKRKSLSLMVLKEEEDEDDNTSNDEGDGDGPVAKRKKRTVVIPEHITVLNGDPIMYQCAVCEKKFKTKSRVKYHEFCQTTDDDKEINKCRLRTHTGHRPSHCSNDIKVFSQQSHLNSHDMQSRNEEKSFACQECDQRFAYAEALQSHSMDHSSECAFACTQCDKQFKTNTRLQKHTTNIHSGERLFVCDQCDKRFLLKSTLTSHKMTHSNDRPHVCNLCTRAFHLSKDLVRHFVIHTGERLFRCIDCERCFGRKDNLCRHHQMRHNRSKEEAKKLADEMAAAVKAIRVKTEN